jgi:hypothetical protein
VPYGHLAGVGHRPLRGRVFNDSSSYGSGARRQTHRVALGGGRHRSKMCDGEVDSLCFGVDDRGLWWLAGNGSGQGASLGPSHPRPEVLVARTTAQQRGDGEERWLGFCRLLQKLLHKNSPIYKVFTTNWCATRTQTRS